METESQNVVALNQRGELFLALASAIHGKAANWPESARAQLAKNIRTQYGPLLEPNTEDSAQQLMALAISEPSTEPKLGA